MKLSEKQKGIIALVGLAACYAFMGVFTRYLALNLALFQQVYFRLASAFIIGVLIFYKQINYSKLKRLSIKEWLLLIFRAATYYLFGTILFNKAILMTKISTVSFISSIPYTAILGFILLREKITWKKTLYILLAFIGVVIISVKDYSSILIWGPGEILALLSAILCSLSIVLRRFQSKLLSNIEMTQVIIFLSFIMVFIGSFFMGEGIPKLTNFSLGVITAIFFGGLMNILIINLTNLGFEKIETSLAANILTLEMIFAVIFGFIFFKEISTVKELIGGLLILFSVIQMNKLE